MVTGSTAGDGSAAGDEDVGCEAAVGTPRLASLTTGSNSTVSLDTEMAKSRYVEPSTRHFFPRCLPDRHSILDSLQDKLVESEH